MKNPALKKNRPSSEKNTPKSLAIQKKVVTLQSQNGNHFPYCI